MVNPVFAVNQKKRNSASSYPSTPATEQRRETRLAEHRYGPVEGFPAGSWWGIRMDCSRDRVHGPFDSDIQDGPAGAISLCTSHLNIYNDEDLGDSLTYTGPSYQPGAQSNHSLLKSYRSQVPLRLVRSYNLTNDFAPKTGYRYDGLYTVSACWIGVSPSMEKRYKFALSRISDRKPPPWRQSLNPSNKTINEPKKKYASQSRCNNERLTTNVCNETRPTTDNQDPSTNPRHRNKTTKLGFAKSSDSNITDKTTKDSKRDNQDSAILTRCISIKKPECPTSAGINRVLCTESLAQKVHRILENPVKATSFKLQNTNISIRTDLYDSSHNIQHETKKNVPMNFCRTFVTARHTRVVNHANVGPLNLNSCGPCPREGQQGSLIQLRSGVSKTFAIKSPSLELQNRNVDRSTPRINHSTSFLETKMHFDTIDARILDTADNDDSEDCMAQDRPTGKRLEMRQRNKDNSPTKTVENMDNKATSNDEDVCPILVTMSNEKLRESPDTGHHDTKEKRQREQRVAIDSLTPEQMLKYIMKQKYHPTAKLLIDNVIGLTESESKILRTYDSLMSRGKCSNRDNENLRGAENVSPAADNTDDTSIRVRNKSVNLIVKDRSPRKLANQKIVAKERIFTMRLRRTRVSKRLLVSEKKSTGKTDDKTSASLRSMKITEKIQQPFAKSTSTKNSKKCTKKRRSELANLVIDANIGPKIRGPRNRRLRGGNRIFPKKFYEMDISNCCDMKGKSSKSRIELTSTRNKLITSASKSRVRQSRYIRNKQILQKSEANIVERNVEKAANNNTMSGQRDSADLSIKHEERKMSQRQSYRRYQVFENSNDSGKRLRYRQEEDVSEMDTERVPKMVDAATQCTDEDGSNARRVVADPTRFNWNVDPEHSIKVEWINLDDVKSESWSDHDDDSRDAQSEFSPARAKYGRHVNCTNCEHLEVRMKPRDIGLTKVQKENPPVANVIKKLSAFVAVNIPENDLRIKKLRSIGFRPIEPPPEHRGYNEDTENTGTRNSKDHNLETVLLSRVADERYNKYTSEETTVVGYMDQHLRYQDIEKDVVTLTCDCPVAGCSHMDRKIGNKLMSVQNAKTDADTTAKIGCVTTKRVSTSLEDDSEIPWHGWKQFF